MGSSLIKCSESTVLLQQKFLEQQAEPQHSNPATVSPNLVFLATPVWRTYWIWRCRWRRRWWRFCRMWWFWRHTTLLMLSTWRGVWCFYHDFFVNFGFVRILGQIQQFERQSPEPVKILHFSCLCCWYSFLSILPLPSESALLQAYLATRSANHKLFDRHTSEVLRMIFRAGKTRNTTQKSMCFLL